MKKLDKGDKMIVASLILAIGIVLGAYFIANQKSDLERCLDRINSIMTCTEMIKG
tara:strand:+ start:101 stop:265 length:165 start_codon:yes stop_codon:yes gene_type:complete